MVRERWGKSGAEEERHGSKAGTGRHAPHSERVGGATRRRASGVGVRAIKRKAWFIPCVRASTEHPERVPNELVRSLGKVHIFDTWGKGLGGRV